MSASRRFKKLSIMFSSIVVLIGLLVLIGWLGNIYFLKSIFREAVSMKVNAAICFILAGCTVILYVQKKNTRTTNLLISVFAFIIFLIGALTLFEFVFSFNAGIDELFFNDTGYNAELPPGMQSPFSAAYFMVFGFFYLPPMRQVIKARFFQLIHITSLFFVLASVVSYFLGTYVIGGASFNYIHVIHSTISFLLLILAVLFSDPDEGIMKLVSSNTTGGKIIRRYLFLFVLMIIAVGWLQSKGVKAGYFNSEFGMAAFVILMIFFVSWIVFSSALFFSRSEKSLAESETRLRTILDTVPECIKIIDQEKGLVYINPSGMEMVEAKDFEQIKGSKIYQTIHKKYLENINQVFSDVFEGAEGLVEYEITGLKGAHRWMEAHVVQLMDSDNESNSLLCITRDISERKKTEEKIRKSEERYRTLVEQATDAIFIMTMNGKPVTVNDVCCKLSGYTREELMKMNVYDMVFKEDVENNPIRFAEIAKGDVVKNIRRMKRKDGSAIEVEVSAKLLTSGDVLVFGRDISDTKKAAEKIRLYNDQLRQLAANLQNIREEERARIGREIHDELGQWLTVLKMEISRVKKIKNDETKLNEAIEEMLSQVDGCIQSSRKISTELRPTVIDDLGLIAALEWQAEEFGKRTGIRSEFTTDITDIDIPPDYTIAIFRIFQESLTNVARHSGAGKVKSEFYLSDGNINLKIIDDGKGFDKAKLETKKTLGIIGMKERTLLMNGSYEIHSAPGKGTEIRVIIPLPFG